MERKHRNARRACTARASWIVAAVAAACIALPASAAKPNPSPKWSTAKAFDVSKPARELPAKARAIGRIDPDADYEVRPERGAVPQDRGHSGDGALQKPKAGALLSAQPTIGATIANFEGLSNQDNFNLFGFRVNPPDPVGDVGPNHYVQMINLAFAVYDKQGNLLLGPVDTGTLWSDFPIEDCTDPSGDPIVVYDQLEDRWILSQFTTRGPDILQLRRDLADRRPDRRVLPVRVRDAARSGTAGRHLLPRLPEVRRVDELVRHDHPRLRRYRRVRHQRLRAGEEQDARRQPERPRGPVLPRLERGAAQPDRRRPASRRTSTARGGLRTTSRSRSSGRRTTAAATARPSTR